MAILSVILSAASAPIAIRYAQAEGVLSLAIIAIRLTLSSLILAPFVFRKGENPFANVAFRDWLWILLAGTLHASALVFLFFSLENTSVFMNSVLRRVSPFFVVGMEILLLSVVFPGKIWIAIFLTVGGTIIAGLGNASALNPGPNPMLGNSLAVGYAFATSAYLVIGRKFRLKLPFLPYSWLVFTSAAVVALLVAIFTQTPIIGYAPIGYLWVVIVTIIAQIFGHLPINAAIRYFPATYVSIALQTSVILAGLFGLLFFNEIPSIWQILGGVLIMSGVTVISKK